MDTYRVHLYEPQTDRYFESDIAAKDVEEAIASAKWLYPGRTVIGAYVSKPKAVR